jgi:hypothetical protein
VPFSPDVAVVAVIPTTIDPSGVGMWGLLVGSGNPDVAVTVPAMVASVPGPIGVLVGTRWNYLADTSGRADAHYDLRVCYSCGESKSTDCREKKFVHEALSL